MEIVNDARGGDLDVGGSKPIVIGLNIWCNPSLKVSRYFLLVSLETWLRTYTS